MANLDDHIVKLNTQLQLLLKQHNGLILENAQQKKLLQKLEVAVREQKVQLEKMEQEKLLLKASLDSMNEEEKKILEQKINGYIRNIDKCISLLGHK